MLYSIKDIEIYLHSQNSYGDIFYNLKNIDKIIAEEKKKALEKDEDEEDGNFLYNYGYCSSDD